MSSRHVLHRDIETKSTLDLPDVGAWRYAVDPTTGVWCVSFAIDDKPAQIWTPGQPIPEVFHIAAPDPDWLIVAHNDAFERAIEERILAPQYGWPIVPLERHRCTMAMTLASALPAGLKGAAEAFGLPQGKDIEGARLMRQMARPRKPRKGEDPNGIYFDDDPEHFKRLCTYTLHDTDLEREIYRRVPALTDPEQALWELDQRINERGFYTDGALLNAAHDLVTKTEAALQTEFRELTGLDSTNQTAKLIAWLAEHDCTVTDVQKGTLMHALRRKGLEDAVRRAIELRLKLAHASADKVNALLAWRDNDGRVRGTLKFHGAGTGRWSGHGPQPHNFKRDSEGVEAKIAAIINGGKGLASPVEAVGEIARAMICAAPGHRLFIGDYGAIESRITAWASGQQSKIDLWKRFDQTGNPDHDPYVVFGRAIGHPEVSARAYGKVGDLAFGFGGGVPAWRNFAPEEDASDEATIKRYRDTWRARHPKTKQFWYGLDNAAIRAIRRPGTDHQIGRFTFRFDAPFLRAKLPSRRLISYPFAEIMPEPDRFGHPRATFLDTARGKFGPSNFGHGAWAGIWCENVVSGVARDLLSAALQRLEAAGYPVILHVHDEIVCEVPIDFGSLEEFHRLITALPEWAEDLPIAAKVRNGQRFAKSENASAPEPTVTAPDPVDTDAKSDPTDMDEAPAGEPGAEVVIEAPRPELEDALANMRAAITAGATGKVPKETPKASRTRDRRAGNGFDHSAGNYENARAETHIGDADKPYGPIRARLLSQGYRVAKTFPFTVPGEETPRFCEDRFELKAELAPSAERPRKTSRFWHPGNGKPLNGTGPRRIVFNWPAIMQAPPETPVYITEGANKSAALNEAGLIATAAPYHQWGPECAAALVGRPLIYHEDHDHPDANGAIKAKEFSAVAREKLTPGAASFRIIPALHLWKNLGRDGEPPHGWDVKDWLESGGDVTKLLDICGEISDETSSGIIEPVDLWGRFDPPLLPTGLLPEVLERFAFEEAELTGADPSGIATAALVVCAAALPDYIQVQVKKHDPNWMESARIWVGLIGLPSTKKTPIIQRVAKPLKRLDAELWRAYVAACECYERLSKEERKLAERPKQQRLRIEDCTIEAAQEVLKDSPNGVLAIQDELAGWFGAMDKYSGRGAAKDRGFWLQSFHGGPYALNRIARGSTMIENLSVSLLGGIQPEPIRKIAEDTVDDGLLQRLIPIVLRHATAGKDLPTGEAAQRYDCLIECLHQREHPGAPLRFNDAALAIREELERRHLSLMACEIINRKLAAHIGKYDGLFARLCLLWHCIEGAEELTVTEFTARRVADFMRCFLLPHATAFYAGMLELSDDHDRLTQVAGYILAKGLSRVTNRDVQRGSRVMRGLERLEIEGIFEQLEALGWLMRTPSPYRSTPPHWQVNPEVHRRFAERAVRETAERAKEREILHEMFKGGSVRP
jgi:hypothetical protein